MNILPPLFLAISASIDNFTVGVAYGIKKIEIQFISNLIIAVISALGTFLSMTIGLLLCRLLSAEMSNIIGCSLLILIGIWFIIEYFIKKIKMKCRSSADYSNINYKELLDKPESVDFDKSGNIDIRESVILGIALMINNLGLGISASISGINIYLTTICTFIISIITIPLGFFIGKHCFSKLSGEYASLISGLIIVALGIYEIFI